MSVWVALVIGMVIGVAVYLIGARLRMGSVGAQAQDILEKARVERERLLHAAEMESREVVVAAKEEHEERLAAQREEMAAEERGLREREGQLERRQQEFEQRQRELGRREHALAERESEVRDAQRAAEMELEGAKKEIERVAELTRDAAREELVKAVEDEARVEAGRRVQELQRKATEEAEQKAREVLASAVQRLAGSYVAEKTVTVVKLPNDEMKGRIIGREGRNIRAFENATGVDLIIDDTPEAVVLSAFNPERREVARMALEKLIKDGRIHPATIEDIVKGCRAELRDAAQTTGEDVAADLGLHGLDAELLRLVGTLKHRNIGGQNLLTHAQETATIAGLMAEELLMDAAPAKRAGLFHAIGRAVEHEVEGNHAEVAAEQARRFGEPPEVVDAIAQHLLDEPTSLLAVVLGAARATSRARPGARSEALESYVKRLKDLENISLSFDGVEQAWAMQAGREVRVAVNFGQVSDQDALLLSGEIARRIEHELTYPGEVKIIVIREARVTEIAR